MKQHSLYESRNLPTGQAGKPAIITNTNDMKKILSQVLSLSKGQCSKKLFRKLLVGFFVVFIFGDQKSWGQTTVFSDDFSTNQSATYTTSGPIGASSWIVTRSGGDLGARRNTSPAQLELTNDASAAGNSAGWVVATTPTTSFLSPYNTTLSSNAYTITWTFNMRQSVPDPTGFNFGKAGVAFILAGTSNSTKVAGQGYAVVLGTDFNGDDRVRLAHYDNGFGLITESLTDMIIGSDDIGNEYLSIKVIYTPLNNNWQLFVRNDGASAFADPATGVLTSQGALIDATYTGMALNIMGGVWNAQTGGQQTSFFDNVKVIANGPPLPVTLSSANVTGEGCKAKLNWSTSSEDGFNRFEVEYSRDAMHYTKVGTVASHQAPNGSVYSFVYDQGMGKGYYRIKIINNDGTFSYSQTLRLDSSCLTRTIKIYPNPVVRDHNLTVNITGYEGNLKADLIAVNGQVVRSWGMLKNGANVLPLEKLTQATYMLRVTAANGSSESFRIIIIK